MSGLYGIGKYYRLSSEDADLQASGRRESDSIANQRQLVEAFIARTPELARAQSFEYCDDGWSGRSFDRPALRRMLDDVRSGRLRCIIVKDLSRFGRDYLTVGHYLTRVFPFLQVRFIAVNDGFDSLRSADVDSLETSFRTLLHDLYSRDLSRKVRSAMRQRAKTGAFLSAFAPYGYRKDAENRGRLLPDPPAAAVVRRIFRLAADGVTTGEIAKRLNEENIMTPMRYKRAHGCSRTLWPCVQPDNLWTEDSVRFLLRDERYLGRSIYGKRARERVGTPRTACVSRSDWVTVEHAQPAIVEPALFAAAQACMKLYAARQGRERHTGPLSGKVRCGVCGRAMDRTGGAEPSYRCGTPRSVRACACPRESIPEQDLLDVALEMLCKLVEAETEPDFLSRERRRRGDEASAEPERELAGLRDSLLKHDARMRALYEAFVCGNESREGYLRRRAEGARERAALVSRAADCEARLRAAAGGESGEGLCGDLRDESGRDAIPGALLREALACVRVFPGKRLQLVWRLRNGFGDVFSPEPARADVDFPVDSFFPSETVCAALDSSSGGCGCGCGPRK